MIILCTLCPDAYENLNIAQCFPFYYNRAVLLNC